MIPIAGSVLTGRQRLHIVGAFRAERALSGPSARRLKDLGLRDSRTLRELITSDVIRKAGPERYFLDERMWASRHHWPFWQLALVLLGVLLAVAVGVAFLKGR
jgi:hypothetical protein